MCGHVPCGIPVLYCTRTFLKFSTGEAASFTTKAYLSLGTISVNKKAAEFGSDQEAQDKL